MHDEDDLEVIKCIHQSDGEIEWRKGGNLHRIDGPARVSPDGSKHWLFNGHRHRVDGPAIEWSSGSKDWFVDGKRHRVDGPAIYHWDGKKSWYLRGKFFKNKQAFFEALTDEEKSIALFSEDFLNA